MTDFNDHSRILVVLACGLGTYLLRLLPFYARRTHNGGSNSPLSRFSAAIGPAAIASLLVITLEPIVTGEQTPLGWAGVAAGMMACGIVYKIRGGIAGPTLAGALAYGALLLIQSIHEQG